MVHDIDDIIRPTTSMKPTWKDKFGHCVFENNHHPKIVDVRTRFVISVMKGIHIIYLEEETKSCESDKSKENQTSTAGKMKKKRPSNVSLQSKKAQATAPTVGRRFGKWKKFKVKKLKIVK